MNIIIISIIAIIALGAIVMIGTKFFGGKNDEPIVVPASDCSTCDGVNTACEQVCQMEAATKPVEYFDDEELDAYKGRSSDSYSDDEAAEFADVLETLRAEDVKPWNRSLILRGINMPDQIKDEYIALAEG